MGLRKKVWIRNPDSESAPPKRIESMMRGRRIFQITLYATTFESSRRRTISRISFTVISTLPLLMLQIAAIQSRTKNDRNTMPQRMVFPV